MPRPPPFCPANPPPPSPPAPLHETFLIPDGAKGGPRESEKRPRAKPAYPTRRGTCHFAPPVAVLSVPSFSAAKTFSTLVRSSGPPKSPRTCSLPAFLLGHRTHPLGQIPRRGGRSLLSHCRQVLGAALSPPLSPSCHMSDPEGQAVPRSRRKHFSLRSRLELGLLGCTGFVSSACVDW